MSTLTDVKEPKTDTQNDLLNNPASEGFVDRRRSGSPGGSGHNGTERRQFGNSHRELSEEARELAVAIDQYKLNNRRRYITFEEMYNVIQSLGYHK